MIQLTVGHVAGIIAAGIFVARLWAPNVLVYIVSALLPNRASASTWTIVARAFQRSHWPDVLRSDAVMKRGVRLDILLLTKLISFMGALIGIAGVVTPLGLYQALLPDKNVQTPFKYLEDTSPFGYGTPPRSNFSFNRVCSTTFAPIPCPFTDSVSTQTSYPNGTIDYEFPYGIDMALPKIITDTYSSGTGESTTVSNFFDVQWRRYSTTSDKLQIQNNGSEYLIGASRNIENLVMNNDMVAVEGLVVDTVNGSIGFRNHTVPPGFKHGVTWKEDLLFVEPDTVCVDTNMTIDFTVISANNTIVKEVVLTDRGGFVNLNHTYPTVDMSNPQKNPNLYDRAYKAAWLQNAFLMLLWNVTNIADEESNTHAFSYLKSTINKTFPIPLPSSLEYDGLRSLQLTGDFGTFAQDSGSFDSTSSSNSTSGNPFNMGSSNFSTINLLCSGAGNGDFANSTNILVSCGSMVGVPQRQNPGSSLVFEGGSVWSQKVFTCASAVKASVKTVSFNYNGTEDSLKNLAITSIEQKVYADEASTPIWAVEDTGNAYTSGDIGLVWGLISPDYEKKPNVSSIRNPFLYLPGWFDYTLPSAREGENIPAADFPVNALAAAYCVDSEGSCTSDSVQDYTGETSLAMWARWQNLTKDARSASIIPNLIFTDNAASAVVGTKGVLGPGNTAQKNLVALPVTPTLQKIRYHYLYAIPALLAALLLVLITFLAFLVTCFRGIGIHRMRLHLQQTSPGRIYTTFLYPGPGGLIMRSREWASQLGRKKIDLSGEYPLAADVKAPEKGMALTSYERSANSVERQALVTGGHVREASQGDIGYGFAQPQPYHNQYDAVPPASPKPGNPQY